jgi:hypothetical protein
MCSDGSSAGSAAWPDDHLWIVGTGGATERKRPMRWFLRNQCFSMTLAALVAVLSTHCGAPTSPTSVGVIGIRYERVRSFVPGTAGPVVLTLIHPHIDDPYGRTDTFLCVMQPAGENAFICAQTRQIPVNADCSVWVTDPAVSANTFHQAAAAVFVNGQAVDRIDVYGNGIEIGQFRMTADGRIQ